jgi:hypothetical protein
MSKRAGDSGGSDDVPPPSKRAKIDPEAKKGDSPGLRSGDSPGLRDLHSHRLLICGSRDFTDADKFERMMEAWNRRNNEPSKSNGSDSSTVISGMAEGADTLAVKWAKARNIPVLEFPISKDDYKRYRRGAGPKRNNDMATQGKPTVILGFPKSPADISPGTKDMLNIGVRKGIPTFYASDVDWVRVVSKLPKQK